MRSSWLGWCGRQKRGDSNTHRKKNKKRGVSERVNLAWTWDAMSVCLRPGPSCSNVSGQMPVKSPFGLHCGLPAQKKKPTTKTFLFKCFWSYAGKKPLKTTQKQTNPKKKTTTQNQQETRHMRSI